MTARQELLQTIAELELRRAELQNQLLLEQLRGGDGRRIGQDKSQLGRRKHIAAVRRRLQEEEDAGEAPGTRGAFISGRRHLLTEQALAEELGRGSRGVACKLAKGKPRPGPANDAAEETEDETEERLLRRWRTQQ